MEAYSYPKSLRLRKSNEFTRLKKNAHKVVADNFIICCKPNDYKNPRLGVIVTKRYSKKAVIRNKLKRIIRESFRYSVQSLKAFDYVVIVRHNKPIMNYLHFRRDIDKVWQTWKN